MFKVKVSQQLKMHCEQQGQIYNLGQRHTANGNPEQQLTGIIGQSVVLELFGEKWFDGKNHMPVAAEEVAEFTGIPVYQVEKNEFAFKAREPEDYVRASLVRLALCDLVNDIISGLDPEEALDVGSGPVEDAACYINFCLENGIITQEQGLSIYMQIKQKIQLDLPFIAGITGLDVEVLKKMAQA